MQSGHCVHTERPETARDWPAAPFALGLGFPRDPPLSSRIHTREPLTL